MNHDQTPARVRFSDPKPDLELVCGECVGARATKVGAWVEPTYEPCPSCGGTGFSRLVALDGISRGALERATYMLERMSHDLGEDTQQRIAPAFDVLRSVLDALDGGQE